MGNKKTYSIIIPTMWYANSWLLPMLKVYQKHSAIKEILIINNRNSYSLDALKEPRDSPFCEISVDSNEWIVDTIFAFIPVSASRALFQ